jgi:hypothetical protein
MDFSEFLQPAIFGLTGKPGAGKSYFATRLIIAEITKGKNRPIVSNVPINKKKLREYVKKDFYYYDLETYTDNKAFFTNRGYYHIDVDDLGGNVDFKPLLQENDEGVLFIIDEAHLYFNARNWKHMPQATISYITTIRHVGDSLIWMCQRFSDIDSQIRGKTQAFHLLRNLQKEKLGIFKRGTGFRCYQYLEECHISSHGSQTARPAQDFKYPFDIKIAECYSTSLFNKSHDKKYRVKAIPLPYIIYTCITLFVLLMYWVATGGFTTIMSKIIPDMSPTQETIQTAEVINAFESPITLPVADPFLEKNSTWYESPNLLFSNGSDNLSTPFKEQTADSWERDKEYFFGNSRKCKLVFVSDKNTDTKNTGFSFSYSWNEFAQLNRIDLSFEKGVWMVQTPYFLSFLEFVRDRGKGANLKEIDVTLKENVIFELEHGYEIPIQSSVTSQGVIQTQTNFKQVGFNLNLLFQTIQENEALRVKIQNSDVMDMTSDVPVLQTFMSENIVDVEPKMTYQIADFKSTTASQNKGIFSSSSIETTITNKLFIIYGDI